MKEEVLCSVVIPVYRCETYLAQTLRSVLDQTVSDIEVLVVDDCSPDRSGEIAMQWAGKDSRVRYLRHTKNQGVAQARNTGIREARGKWIAFLDGDDLWMPNKLERQFQALSRQDSCALCCTGAVFFREDGAKEDKIEPVPLVITYDKLRYGNVIITSSVLVKREIMVQYPMERSDLQEDFIAWLRILKDCGAALGVNEPLVRYRIAAGSKSYNKFRSALCTWKTYRYMGWPLLRRVGYFTAYIFHGLRRYL